MKLRAGILFFLLLTGMSSLYAQWSEQDSLNLQRILSGEGEIQLNPEAIRDIRLESPSINLPDLFEPLMQQDESILRFNEELPTFFTDSVSQKKMYMTLKPYTAFTKYNEDPVYGDKKGEYIWPMATKAYIRPYEANEYRVRPPLPSAGGSFHTTLGGASVSFSMEDLLQSIFSKKGRARLRNAKHANAWKTY